MLYQLLFNTHYFLLHTSYIFIFLYFYINLYVYLYIFLQFSYGLLTANSRLALQFSLTVFFLLQFPLPPTVASLTVGSVRFPLRSSLRLSIRPTRRLALYGFLFLLLLSLYVLLFSFHTHYKSPLYSG